jgi:hypothetical protein
MPLHEWSERPDWDNLHPRWVARLLRWVRPRLSPGYRAFLGSAPALAAGAPTEFPDPGADDQPPEDSAAAVPHSPAPDEELEVSTLRPDIAVMVERGGKLVAVLEVVSPRQKDRPLARTVCLTRYLAYLMRGINLVVVDVFRRPLAFSFADRIAAELQAPQPSCPAPLAVAYRVGAAADGGRRLAVWRRQLVVGAALPVLPLPLAEGLAVVVDLEATYSPEATDTWIM